MPLCHLVTKFYKYLIVNIMILQEPLCLGALVAGKKNSE